MRQSAATLAPTRLSIGWTTSITRSVSEVGLDAITWPPRQAAAIARVLHSRRAHRDTSMRTVSIHQVCRSDGHHAGRTSSTPAAAFGSIRSPALVALPPRDVHVRSRRPKRSDGGERSQHIMWGPNTVAVPDPLAPELHRGRQPEGGSGVPSLLPPVGGRLLRCGPSLRPRLQRRLLPRPAATVTSSPSHSRRG